MHGLELRPEENRMFKFPRLHRQVLICIKPRKSSFGDANTFQQCSPEPPHLCVPALDCRIDGIANVKKLWAFQKQDLSLHHSAALKLDPSQREHKRVFRCRLERQQCGRPDRGMQCMSECRGIYEKPLVAVLDIGHRLGKPRSLPCKTK